MISEFFIPASPGHIPGADGYFGAFGGKFIPEALVAAVDEVAIEYERAKADPGFAAELEQLLTHYAGRPSVLTEVARFDHPRIQPGDPLRPHVTYHLSRPEG